MFMWLSYGNNFSTPSLVWAWHLYVLVSVGFVNVSIPESLPLLLLRFLPCPGWQVGTCPLWWGWTRGPGTHSSSFPFSTDSLWNWHLSHSPAFPWPMKSLTHLFLVSICVPWYTERSICIIEHLPNCSPEASWRGRKGEFPFSEELCTLHWGSSWGNVTGAYCRGVWAGDGAGEEGTVTVFVYIASNFILVWNAVTLCWHFGFRVSALLQVFSEEQLWTSLSLLSCIRSAVEMHHFVFIKWPLSSEVIEATEHDSSLNCCHGTTCANVFTHERMRSSQRTIGWVIEGEKWNICAGAWLKFDRKELCNQFKKKLNTSEN